MIGKVRKQRQSHVCIPCKLKKVKCDKLHPTCSRCRQEMVTCFYGDGKPPQNFLAGSLPSSNDSPDTLKAAINVFESPNQQIYDLGIVEEELKLRDPHDMLVAKGTGKFMEYPFGPLSSLQHDIYTRSLCGSLHGTTLMEWRQNIKNDRTMSGGFESIPNYDVQTEMGPLPFIDTAIKKYIELKNTEQDNTALSPMPESQLLLEVEQILLVIESVDLLLQHFHDNVYPFFPFIEFSAFRHTLDNILIRHEVKFKLNKTSFQRRSNLEVLALFILILSLSIDALLVSSCGKLKSETTETSKALLALGEKLLLNIGAPLCENEMTFSCMLYLYVAKYLNSSDLSVIESSEFLYELRNLHERSLVLGLQHTPRIYKRLLVDRDCKTVITFRWKLWVGLQFLTFQIATPHGGVNKLDTEYMQAFLAEERENFWFGSMKGLLTNDSDALLLDIWRKKYKLCILTSGLMANCCPITGHPKLSKIVEDTNALEEYLSSAFPEPRLSVSSIDCSATRKTENVEIFLANVAGLTCLMNVYEAVALCYEKKCVQNTKRRDAGYRTCLLKFMRTHLQLLKLLTDYLSGSLCIKPGEAYCYVINKLVISTLIKIWVSQSGVLLRLSFKTRQLPDAGYYLPPSPSEDQPLHTLMYHLRQQMSYSLDLSTNVLTNEYFSCFQAVCMFRYIVYAVDVGRLAYSAIKFWKMIEYGEQIPNSIKVAISMKWGLDTAAYDEIEEKLTNPSPLVNDEDLMRSINDLNEMSRIIDTIPKEISASNSDFDKIFDLDDIEIVKQFSEGILEKLLDFDGSSFFS